MAFLSRNDNETVGLDIDGAYLAAAIVDGGSVKRLVSMDLAPGITSDGEVSDAPALTEAIKDLFSRHKLPRSVRLGVSNQQIVVRQLDLPMIADPDELEAAVRFQAADAIAMPLEEAVLDYQVIGTHDTAEGVPRQTVVVVAARASMIVALVDAVKAAGVKVEGVDLNAFALVRLLGEPGLALHDPEHSVRVLCHLGGITNLAIAVGDVCVFTRPLQTSWDEDEATAASIAEEIRMSIDYYRAAPDSRQVASIVLSGPGSHNEAIREAIYDRTGLPASTAEPLGHFGLHTVPSLDDPARYTVATGLAIGEAA